MYNICNICVYMYIYITYPSFLLVIHFFTVIVFDAIKLVEFVFKIHILFLKSLIRKELIAIYYQLFQFRFFVSITIILKVLLENQKGVKWPVAHFMQRS